MRQRILKERISDATARKIQRCAHRIMDEAGDLFSIVDADILINIECAIHDIEDLIYVKRKK